MISDNESVIASNLLNVVLVASDMLGLKYSNAEGGEDALEDLGQPLLKRCRQLRVHFDQRPHKDQPLKLGQLK